MLTSLAVVITGCSVSPETRLRRGLAVQDSGDIHLPSGVIEISSELHLAAGARDLNLIGNHTVLKAAANFHGRALLVIEHAANIQLQDFTIDGNRDALHRTSELVPPENAFRIWYRDSGILCDEVEGLHISHLELKNVASFPILVSRSSDVHIEGVDVSDSGTLNAKGRNNTTGGILLEEGTLKFDVTGSKFNNIRGNGLWTHSLRTSPRGFDGLFANNEFDGVGRDAIQVGHATRVRVFDNIIRNVGFPSEQVDVENGGTPVGIDTAGNVGQSIYARNHFEEINGKCFDLDGFHDGNVRDNTCLNKRPPADYPFGHYGIVMNNTDPDMNARGIEISGNHFDGMKFGALYLIGSGHRILGNQFLNVNTAGCNDNLQFGCLFKPDEPDLLRSGIYVARGVARLEETKGNLIRDNTITGHGMELNCVKFAPGVDATQNQNVANHCSDHLDEPMPRKDNAPETPKKK
jgi:hypothetical protein